MLIAFDMSTFIVNVLETILLVLAGYIVVVTSLTNLFWIYETVNTGHVRHLRQQCGASLAGAWRRLFVSCISSQLIVFSTYLLGYLPALQRTGGKPGRPPVLYVHGLYHNPSGWIFFRKWLRPYGFTRSKSLFYFSFCTDYFTVLAKLARAVDDLRKEYPGEQVVLVGHSLGGLLIRGYLASPECRDAEGQSKVAAAVSLGAPLRGSKLAALGMGGLARSLLYKGPLFTTLEEQDAPPPCPVLAITTPLDNFVLPADASFDDLPGWTFVEGPLVSHVAMIYDRKIAAMTGEFLSTPSTS